MSERLARHSDPGTSHEAAASIRPKLSNLQARTLTLVAAWPDHTATELSKKAGTGDPRVHNRRLTELRRAGRIVISGSRKCEVTGRRASTYRIPASTPTQGQLF